MWRRGTKQQFLTRALVAAVATFTSAASALTACGDDEHYRAPAKCPNKSPQASDGCTPGLVCSYADKSGCAPQLAPYFSARCQSDGHWLIEDPCAGQGGAGGVAAGGHGGATSTGGKGGAGGGRCVDEVAGPPQVVSALQQLFAPDISSGFYRLQFNEAVGEVAPHVTWTGAGEAGNVSKAGNAYNVYFAAMAPGDSATITIDGVMDSCGTVMAAPVVVEVGVRPNCHLFAEDFSAGFAVNGWTIEDAALSGNQWQTSALVDPPNGVVNHTAGSGSCATTNDAGSLPANGWNTSLRSAAIDLTGETDVALKYRGALSVPPSGADAYLEASSDGGSWTVLSHWTADRGPAQEAVDLSAYAGGAVYLRWRYANAGGTNSWWDIDDVCVESFTKANCPCPVGGFSEIADLIGSFDGNGTLGAAENSGVMLSAVGQRVTVCGRLEDNIMQGTVTPSGPDFYGFWVATGGSGSAVKASVNYCIENAFDSVTTQLWVKSDGVAISTFEGMKNQGSYLVDLLDGNEHFLSLTPAAGRYPNSRYVVSVEVKEIPLPLLAESFEVWPPPSFTVTDDDPCLDWAQSTLTVVPPGEAPTAGQNLAYFNSFDCNVGSESLETAPLNFVGFTALTLTFDMFHDTGYANSLDAIQIEYNEQGTWLPIGSPFVRPAATQGWVKESLNLTPLVGKPAVRLRLKATTAYGNNIHIDNVLLLTN